MMAMTGGREFHPFLLSCPLCGPYLRLSRSPDDGFTSTQYTQYAEMALGHNQIETLSLHYLVQTESLHSDQSSRAH